jgi:MFS family permease
MYVSDGNRVILLSSTATLPLIGQLCDFFGRRWMMIGVVAVFTLGSGICGGANTTGMLIAGRAIQGIGGGGINLMIELIISDLVPLRERGGIMGILFAVFSLGTSIGPFVGGAIVERSSWRWVSDCPRLLCILRSRRVAYELMADY